MATLFSRFREAPRPPMSVSAEHLFACRANYFKNVVDSFPTTRAFAPHFCDSYVLMKSLSKESSEQVPAGFGLVSLGVRAHTVLPASFVKPLQLHADLLHKLDLETHIMASGAVEVYNRKNIQPSLEAILNHSVFGAEGVRGGLVMLETFFNVAKLESHFYDLLAWPSLVSPNDAFSIYMVETYSGTMNFPVKPDEVLKTGPLVTRAVAVVEQIMGKLKAPPKTGVFVTENSLTPLFCEVPA